MATPAIALPAASSGQSTSLPLVTAVVVGILDESIRPDTSVMVGTTFGLAAVKVVVRPALIRDRFGGR